MRPAHSEKETFGTSEGKTYPSSSPIWAAGFVPVGGQAAGTLASKESAYVCS